MATVLPLGSPGVAQVAVAIWRHKWGWVIQDGLTYMSSGWCWLLAPLGVPRKIAGPLGMVARDSKSVK